MREREREREACERFRPQLNNLEIPQFRVPSTTAHINKDVGTFTHLGTGLGEHLDRRLRKFKVEGTYEGFGLVIPEDSLGPLDTRLNRQLDSPGHLRIVFSCLDSKYSDNWVGIALSLQGAFKLFQSDGPCEFPAGALRAVCEEFLSPGARS